MTKVETATEAIVKALDDETAPDRLSKAEYKEVLEEVISCKPWRTNSGRRGTRMETDTAHMIQSDASQAVVELATSAMTFTVTNQEGLARGSELLAANRRLYEHIKTWFKPLKQKAKDAHSGLCAAENAELRPLEDAYRLIKKAMAEYATAEEARRREEERARREEAARVAEAARKREEDERLARAIKAAEDARRAREEAERTEKATGTVDVALAAVATKLEAKSEAILDAPAFVPELVVQKAEPVKVAGASFREFWTAEVVSMSALVAAVAAGKVPMMALTVNQKFLDTEAKLLRDKLNYPGVKANVEKRVAARGATP